MRTTRCTSCRASRTRRGEARRNPRLRAEGGRGRKARPQGVCRLSRVGGAGCADPVRPRVRGSGRAARPGRCGGRCGPAVSGTNAGCSGRGGPAVLTTRPHAEEGREAGPPLMGEQPREPSQASQGWAAGSPRAAAPAPPVDCAGCSGSCGHACAARDLAPRGLSTLSRRQGLGWERAAWWSRESAQRGVSLLRGVRGAEGCRGSSRGCGATAGPSRQYEKRPWGTTSPQESGRPRGVSEMEAHHWGGAA